MEYCMKSPQNHGVFMGETEGHGTSAKFSANSPKSRPSKSKSYQFFMKAPRSARKLLWEVSSFEMAILWWKKGPTG